MMEAARLCILILLIILFGNNSHFRERAPILIYLISYYYLITSYYHLVKEDKNLKDSEKIKTVWGKLFNTYYRGFFNANIQYLFKKSKKSNCLIEQFSDFIRNMLGNMCSKSSISSQCDFCLSNNYNFYNFSYKNKFTSEHVKILGASANEVPNSFWNMNNQSSINICDFCGFVILNHHLSLTTLSDNSQIFINAPSFKVMWYLNKYAKEIYEKEKIGEVKQILGISLIEMATKLYLQLGRWTKMNIEVVSKWEDKIDFFNLPYEVVEILSDKNIASLLSEIGEFKILNMVLDGKFDKILNFAEKVLKISIKNRQDWDKHEEDFIKQEIKLKKNRENNQNLIEFSQKLLKLYALISKKVRYG